MIKNKKRISGIAVFFLLVLSFETAVCSDNYAAQKEAVNSLVATARLSAAVYKHKKAVWSQIQKWLKHRHCKKVVGLLFAAGLAGLVYWYQDALFAFSIKQAPGTPGKNLSEKGRAGEAECVVTEGGAGESQGDSAERAATDNPLSLRLREQQGSIVVEQRGEPGLIDPLQNQQKLEVTMRFDGSGQLVETGHRLVGSGSSGEQKNCIEPIGFIRPNPPLFTFMGLPLIR